VGAATGVKDFKRVEALIEGRAVVGGVFGLMTTLGASHEHAEYLTERIRSGHYMVIVHTADNVPTAESILENAGGTDVHSMSA